MTIRPIVLAACLVAIIGTPADARRRARRSPPPPPPAPAQQYQSPEDLPEPQRGTYQVLHAFGKA